MNQPYRIIFYDDLHAGTSPDIYPEQEPSINDPASGYPAAQTSHANLEPGGITKEEIAEIIEAKISGLKVYVVESDITEAQNSVRSVVELASF